MINMGLYKEGFNLKISKKQKMNLLIIFIILIIIIGLVILVNKVNFDLFKQNPIKANFDKNPLNLSKKTNTILEITIKNNLNIDVDSPRIEIESIEDGFNVFCDNSTTLFPNIVTIDKISAKNKRKVYCDIRVIDEKILEGTYSFDIKYFINENNYNKRIDLEIIK